MREYGFSTFDTSVHCEELPGEELLLLAEHPELYVDLIDLAEEVMEEEYTLP